MAGRTYRRDARGRFAGNGNTSGGARRALQRKTGADRTNRVLKAKPGNRRSIKNTMSQNPYQRQVDNFNNEYKPKGQRNRYERGKRRPRRIAQDEYSTTPQRVGTIARRRLARAMQQDLRSELKAEGRTMASFRKEYQSKRRYIRA